MLTMNINIKTRRPEIYAAEKRGSRGMQKKVDAQKKIVTIGFGTHRDAKRWLKHMKKADIILLEQTKLPGFKEMIRGKMSPKEFIKGARWDNMVRHNNFAFSKGFYKGLQELNAKGKKIMPILPILPENKSREFVSRLQASEGRIYAAVSTGNFRGAILAIQEYSKTCNELNRIQDEGRAEWVAENIEHMPPRIFMKAGIAHVGLLNELKKKVYGRNTIVEPVYLDKAEAEKRFGKGTQKIFPQPLQLRRYLEREKISRPRANLLAARTLIYNLLENASERKSRPEKDYANVAFVDKLSEQECRAAFNILRHNPRIAPDLNELRKKISEFHEVKS